MITAGKFGVPDVFDTNKYAHDPRHDFLNWSLIDTGTFDYAADAWGYTYGASAECYKGPWALRAGLVRPVQGPQFRQPRQPSSTSTSGSPRASAATPSPGARARST